MITVEISQEIITLALILLVWFLAPILMQVNKLMVGKNKHDNAFLITVVLVLSSLFILIAIIFRITGNIFEKLSLWSNKLYLTMMESLFSNEQKKS
jgi:hypothetical protein